MYFFSCINTDPGIHITNAQIIEVSVTLMYWYEIVATGLLCLNAFIKFKKMTFCPNIIFRQSNA